MQTHAGDDAGPAGRTSFASTSSDADRTAELDQALRPRNPQLQGAFPSRTTDRVRAEHTLALAPGRVLLDRFVLVQVLGVGGACIVFRARDLQAAPNGPRFVALKSPRPDHPQPQRAVERLMREFEHAQRLSHPGIVHVFELQHEGDLWFMTMELLEGESLAMLLRRNGASVPMALARHVLRGTADALHYAHAANIAHGDFSPANVFVVPGDRVKLLDLGAACSRAQQATTAATFAYASPQVLEGATPTVRDDVFSFACVAYELLSGRHPFEFRPATEVRAANARPMVPAGLSGEQALALMSALAWDRETRPADIRALASALLPEPRRMSTRIREPARLASEPDPRSDRPWWLLIAGCVAAMVAAVIVTRIAA